MKFLIIGIGGYVEAVVLPVLKASFPSIEISIEAHSPIKALNISNIDGLTIHKGNYDQYDLILLNPPPWEYTNFLKKIPKNIPLWMEKPIASFSTGDLERIYTLVSQRSSITNVGLNLRHLYQADHVSESHPLTGRIDLQVDYDLNIGLYNWKHAAIDGGIYYTDGIHAIDLALTALGTDAKIKIANTNNKNWNLKV